MLKTALIANMVFSFTSGLLITINSVVLGQIIGIPDFSILEILGPMLIGFAIFIGLTLRYFYSKPIILSITILDFIWVLASIVVICLPQIELLAKGEMLIGLLASVVLTLGLWQLYGLRKLH